jgi:5'(3')-deoxyribonucleotidase
MNKKIIYFDMDNVLVDFASGIARLSEETKQEYEGRLDEVPGIFSLMEPVLGAVEAVLTLSQYFDCYILSTAPWKNPSAWTDKAMWVQKYFGDDRDSVFYKRLIISHHKDLNCGDFLIDDRTKNGAGEFKGELIQFGSERFPDWETVTEYLIQNHKNVHKTATSTLLRAIEIATVAHKGQKDKLGADYILHPIRVMQRGQTAVEKICGVLHDVVEDSDITFEDLENEGFSSEVIAALRCVTKLSDDEDYDCFIERVAHNPVAVQVKINDLLDNMDVTRFRQLTEQDWKRLNKYLKAYQRLREIQENKMK